MKSSQGAETNPGFTQGTNLFIFFSFKDLTPCTVAYLCLERNTKWMKITPMQQLKMLWSDSSIICACLHPGSIVVSINLPCCPGKWLLSAVRAHNITAFQGYKKEMLTHFLGVLHLWFKVAV